MRVGVCGLIESVEMSARVTVVPYIDRRLIIGELPRHLADDEGPACQAFLPSS